MRGGLFGNVVHAAVKLAFYEWAYGNLAERDGDLGVLGEFVVGLYVGGLDRPRREKGLFDLVAADGTTVEVKTSAGGEKCTRGRPRLRWDVIAEQKAVKGLAPNADKWVFLAVSFPETAGRFFDVFDPKWWRAYVVPGAAIRAMGTGVHLSESRLKSEGYAACGLADLPQLVCASGSEAAALARTNTEQAAPLLRLAFFRWAYGDLAEPFNAGRFAEFQVLRLVGRRPFEPRKWKGPVDLVTRGGTAVQVKYSKVVMKGTVTRRNYLYNLNFAHGASPCAFYVFCRLAEPDLDPVPLRNWRFHWVPAEKVPAGQRTVSGSTLEKLGCPALGAAAFTAAVASAESVSCSAECGELTPSGGTSHEFIRTGH